jgi:PEP-CTERM motif-containing protein
MKITCGLICALFGLFLFAPLSRANTDYCATLNPNNLITNCGFETGDFTGWTVTGNDVPGQLGGLYGVEGDDPFPLPAGTAPVGGSFQAYIGDQNADPTTIAETLATAAGSTYFISFFLAQQLEGPGTVNNSVVVKFGGVTLATLTNVAVQGYTEYDYTAVATSAASVFSLRFGNDVGEFIADDINVVTPEPSSLLMVLGGGLLVLFGRKYLGRRTA